MQIIQSLKDVPESAAYDLVVIGAGGAGMAAALFAAMEGAKVLLVEHTEFVGGTTAWSAGTTWVPGTHHSAKVNTGDSLSEAARYLTNAIGERSPAELRQAFLDNGPVAIQKMEAQSEVKFRPYPKHPDYISDLGGSTLNGRALEPLPFDGRLLGELFKLIRPPIPEFTVLGGMMVDRTDINHLLGMTQSFASFSHSIKILLRHGMDRLGHPRGTRLVMGNALVGRLLYSLSRRSNVTLALNTTVEKIGRGLTDGVSAGANIDVSLDAMGVDSVTLVQGGDRRTLHVSGGVVLASGGFNRHAALRKTMLPGIDAAWCPAAPGHTGAVQDLARGLGAHYGPSTDTHAFWAPVSIRPRPDGSQAVFPHFVMDRAKPGMLTVNQAGERFVNESTSYHLFALGMQKANKRSPAIPAFLICDADALRKYGIGMVRPGSQAGDKALQPFLADGYLTQADTLAELAKKLGMEAAGLQASVSKINAYAQTGVDPEFNRGVTAYQQNIGDPAWTGKNPNLGALTQAPFFAVRLYPGDIGASTGLATDAQARALDESQKPIDGLYAVGNDMHSIMGGVYTAPGITIGPGIVFGFLAAQHAVKRTRDKGKH